MLITCIIYSVALSKVWFLASRVNRALSLCLVPDVKVSVHVSVSRLSLGYQMFHGAASTAAVACDIKPGCCRSTLHVHIYLTAKHLPTTLFHYVYLQPLHCNTVQPARQVKTLHILSQDCLACATDRGFT